MSRKSSDNDYSLRSMSNLMGERRKKVNDDGERSLIKAPSSASINSQAVPANAATATTTGDLEREARKQFHQDVTPGFVYVLAAFSALGGFLFGYDTGVISGAMLLLKREMNLSALWQEVLISSTVAAAALSAFAGGFLNGVFGRRVCILLASFIFTSGGIVLSAAPDKVVLLVGRLIVGLGLDGPVIWRMLTYPPTRRALLVGCGLQMFQQLSGINTVMYYGATILQMSGVRDDKLAIWLAGVTAFTNFLFTLLGVWLVEKVGRRKLTLGSIIGTCLSLSLLAIGFLLSAQHTPPVTLHPTDPSMVNSTCNRHLLCEPCMLDPACGFCYRENSTALFASSCVPVNTASTEKAAWGRCSNSTQLRVHTYWAYNYCPTSYSWVVLLGLVLYLAFFAPGMGPMPWTINSEIYPLWARSTGNACSAGVNWTFNFLVSLTFLHVAQNLTYYGAFFLYSGLALLGSFFIYGCLPETKGRRLEEIESLFDNQLCSCGATDSDEDRQVEYIRVKGSNYHLSDNDASDVE
ncbi:proton myo-inositol cotransporter-like isoform X3 [Salvelinus fontinalis]|uniref:proton myo-inositol cotransporter-like isoform X3 n=1 Tax=Salvelinus fontinalis TaxID=8038 RepID=UPI0024856934|nr:proton myo-inositol cotransporter-like isoform X3 [Salvelinus fontinalis]